jgi:hypothetical protein
MENAASEFLDYELLDKDYGRALAVGPGYGEIDPDQYEQFLKSINPNTEKQNS